LNFCHTSRKTIVRDNFSGWNWGLGIIAKHFHNVVLVHNTVRENQEWGIDMHGNGTPQGDDYAPVIKNNLLSLDCRGWFILHREVFDEHVDYNFYDPRLGAMLGLSGWSVADKYSSLADIRRRTASWKPVAGRYEIHGKEGDPGFVDPARGDFRLTDGSPARSAADDGVEIGARASELVEVGAERKWGLGRIPDLGELKLAVESFSSETPSGRAASVVDASRFTYWEIDTAADAKREIVLRVGGTLRDSHPVSERPDHAEELAYLTIVKFAGDDVYFYRQFRVMVDDGSGDWKEVPEPIEHPFTGYRGLYNGETWLLPPGTKARRIKLCFLNGYGKMIRIPEIRAWAKRDVR
jgi:hypothetical protein